MEDGTWMGARARLILLSALMLFVELALIRWAGSNVVYLSYFSNFILLGSFLGIGIGFLRARSERDLFRWAPVALAGFVAFVRLFPVEIDRTGSELIYFGLLRPTGLPTWVTLPIVFAAVAAIMTFIAQGVGRAFTRFEPLEAYRLDIMGSILGIVAFTVLSFLRAPPWVWGVIAAVVFVLLLRPSVRAVHAVALLALVVVLTDESLEGSNSWSPYYKVTTIERGDPALGGTLLINVNGIPHQAVQSVETRRRNEPVYFVPYERYTDGTPEDVLIVGAGNGTDVSIALSEGVRRIDAVEIDPRLYEIGRELHPNRPYDDPRVTVHIDDGRAFLERSRSTYDLILFALPDSLTLVSGQSSLRLESYLFTEEAMREAREHLAVGGVFAMYNYYREEWLIDRLARTLQEAFGTQPCVDSVGAAGHLAVLSASSNADALSCPNAPRDLSRAPEPSADDHPFLYLRTASIPDFYLLTIALILIASLFLIRVSAGPLRQMVPYVDLFFMGVAFLLLETKNVVQFALLFGTTWFVNALVFAGILLSVLAAVELARHVRLARPQVLYALLLATVAVAYVVPQDALLNLSFVPRFAAATALAFAPIFLANLVFAQRFREVGDSTTAFAANLLGAMVGGVLEYVALITGYRTLLIVVAVTYGLAFLTGRRAIARTAAA